MLSEYIYIYPLKFFFPPLGQRDQHQTQQHLLCIFSHLNFSRTYSLLFSVVSLKLQSFFCALICLKLDNRSWLFRFPTSLSMIYWQILKRNHVGRVMRITEMLAWHSSSWTKNIKALPGSQLTKTLLLGKRPVLLTLFIES